MKVIKSAFVYMVPCSDPESFCQRGSNCNNVCFSLIMRGKRVQLPLYDGPTLNAGLEALWFFRGSGPVLQRNLFFVIFQGGGGGAPNLLIHHVRNMYESK